MAEYSRLITTLKGRMLFAKILSGQEVRFDLPRIAVSSKQYDLSELEGLTSLEDIQQSSLVARKQVTSAAAMRVETVFTNEALTAGYYMRTIGLYATDPDEGEILFAVAVETSGLCYMPPFNGLTISGAYISLITEVGNAENVILQVSPAAVATLENILDLENQIKDHVGQSATDESGVHGVRIKDEGLQFKDEEGNFVDASAFEEGDAVVSGETVQEMTNGTYTSGGAVSREVVATMVNGTYNAGSMNSGAVSVRTIEKIVNGTYATPAVTPGEDNPGENDDPAATASDGDIQSIIDNLYK